MASIASAWTQLGAEAHIGGSDPVNWATDDVRLVLLTADFDGSIASFYSDISASEVTGTGYTAGGFPLAGKLVRLEAGPPFTVELDATDVSETPVTLDNPATHVAIVKWTGVATTTRIYSRGVITGVVQPSDGPLTITFNADGILRTYAS